MNQHQIGPPGLSMGTTEPPSAPALTRRERQIAEMIAMGKRNSEIAKELRISTKTISTHREHVLKKIGVANNVLLARYAISVGWVPMPPLGN